VVLHYAILELREIISESELDRIVSRNINLISLFVSLKSTLLSFLEVLSFGIHGDLVIEVTEHLVKVNPGIIGNFLVKSIGVDQINGFLVVGQHVFLIDGIDAVR